MWSGFVNVDLADNWSGKQPDVVADITKKLPFPDHYADEIHAIHVVEHFPRGHVVDILKDWKRVLKPGGKLAIEVPCLNKIVKWLITPHPNAKDQQRLTMIGLYGDWWEKDEMTHRWCYSAEEMMAIMSDVGFQKINILDPIYHQPLRDMRVVAR